MASQWGQTPAISASSSASEWQELKTPGKSIAPPLPADASLTLENRWAELFLQLALESDDMGKTGRAQDARRSPSGKDPMERIQDTRWQDILEQQPDWPERVVNARRVQACSRRTGKASELV